MYIELLAKLNRIPMVLVVLGNGIRINVPLAEKVIVPILELTTREILAISLCLPVMGNT
jgi:hypothetical protein